MTRHLLITAFAAISLTMTAQETLYLIKGDQVVAKYSIDDVDYASFALPDGVTDITDGGDKLQRVTYQSAVGIFHGHNSEVGTGAEFEIQFSTGDITDEQPPLSFLYLQFTTSNVDIDNLALTPGSYTLGDPGTPAPFTFHAGVRQDVDGMDAAGGSLTVERPDNSTTNITLVSDGQFIIKANESSYTIQGLLKLENGDVLDFNYTGYIAIENQSNEQKPADELELPASIITADQDITPYEGYGVVWPQFLADNPRFDYVYILIYADANYEKCLQLGLLVDRDKHPDIMLPKGVYPVIQRTPAGYANADLATMPAFAIKTDTDPSVEYGCWLTENYADYSPLVAGEVEVLEDASNLNNVKLRVALKDNAATPHTVTCTFSGKLEAL